VQPPHTAIESATLRAATHVRQRTQVELLLTMEEFCAGEGVFEPDAAADEAAAAAAAQQPAGDTAAAAAGSSSSSSGCAFAPLFPNLLQLLYDVDVLEEAAITAWAAEKEHADEEDRVFLNKVRCSSGSSGAGRAPRARARTRQRSLHSSELSRALDAC
jgi:hypothetical protein